MIQKICYILSSIGGPKQLGSLFASNVQEDITYIVQQKMPTQEFMEVLVQCLQEEIKYKLHFIKNDTEIKPGSIYFISDHLYYSVENNSIKIKPAEHNLESGPVDSFLFSLCQSPHRLNVLVLSGMFIDRDGIAGIQSVKKAGSQILASALRETPVCDMIDELDKQSLIDHLVPLKSLLNHLHFEFQKTQVTNLPKWLVVDDEEEIRHIIGNILNMEDIECDFAADGLEALGKIHSNHYQAVILDMKMPEMNGRKMLSALQTVDPKLPVLIITGYDDSATHEAQKLKNVIGLLLKPFTGDNILEYVHKLNPHKNSVV